MLIASAKGGGPAPRTYSSSLSSCSPPSGLLVAISSISATTSSGESSSRVNERPVALSGIGPRGRSASFFLPLALPPRCGLASGPKLRLRGADGADGSNGRGGPPNDGGRGAKPPPRSRPGRAGPRSTPSAGRGRARTTILTRAGFAHRERAPVERLAVEPLDGLLGVRTLDVLDEGKSARTTGFAIDRQHNLRRGRDGAEIRTQIRFSWCCTKDCRQTDGQPINSLLN